MKYNAVTRRVKRDDVIDIQVYNSCDCVGRLVDYIKKPAYFHKHTGTLDLIKFQ